MMELFEEIEEVESKPLEYNLRPYQLEAVAATHEAFKDNQSVLMVLATGLGKCFAKDTPIMMYSGRIVPVQEIIKSDLLMGPDGAPRMVSGLARGREKMYKIVPVKGEPYIVNESHILSLKITNLANKKTVIDSNGIRYTSGDIANIDVKTYLSSNKTFKHCAKGYRVGIKNFISTEPIRKNMPAYILGVWLGDGSSRTSAVTTMDNEVLDELKAYAAENYMNVHLVKQIDRAKTYSLSSCSMSWGGNPMNEILRAYNLIKNKHIPHDYKTASWNDRLELLAGLIDTDGSLNEDGCCIDYVSKIKQLSDDFAFVARSVGLYANVKKCKKECCNNGKWGEYYRVTLSGNTSIIPCRIKRKKANARRQKKDVLMTGINVVPCGEDNYYGFTLFGTDRRFLLGDFTVAHNTVCFSHIAKDFIDKGRIMMLAHREELIFQGRDKMEAVTGTKADIEMGEEWAKVNWCKTPIVVSSIQTHNSGRDGGRMSRFKPEEFSLIVVDECFVAGTRVNGVPIEKIKVGDQIDTDKGIGTVTYTFKNPTQRLVRVRFTSGKELICTPNHPIFANGEYIQANNLTKGCMVVSIIRKKGIKDGIKSYGSKMLNMRGRCLPSRHEVRETVFPQKNNSVFSAVQVRTFEKDDCGNIFETQRPDYKLQKNQRNEQAGSAGESINETSGNGLEAAESGRERKANTNSPAGTCERIRLALRSCYTDWMRQVRAYISNVLQGGYRKLGLENSDRSGRKLTQDNYWKSKGQKERRVFATDWVESVEVFQRGSGDEFERLCPDGLVYNLEVSNGNTYFANDILVHNCHHSTSVSYRKVIDYYKQNANIKILGVTATPDRSDEEALGQIFSAVSYEYDIRDGIDDGWLVPIRQQCVTVDGLDYSSCRTTAGDLNNKDIAAILEFEEMLHGFADPTIDLVGDRKCLVFTASVAHAERLTEIFNRHKDGSAEFITGKTPTEIRRNLLARYAKKDFQFLVNVGVATEGFDDPGIEVIVMARPTKSRCLYTQMAGRGTRPLPGLVDGMWSLDERKANIENSTKPYLEIIDFVGNSGRHKLVHAADVLGGKFSDEVVDLATKNVLEKKDKQSVDMLTELRQVEAELHRRRKLAEEAAIRAKLLVKAKFSAAKVNPFDVLDIEPVRERSWHKGRQPSIKQCEMIKRNGLDPDGLSFTHAQQIIKEIIARDIPTPKQAKILRQFGYAENIRKSEASKIITAIVANGWKRPRNSA